MTSTQIAIVACVVVAIGAAAYVATRPPPPPPPTGVERIVGGIGMLISGIVDVAA